MTFYYDIGTRSLSLASLAWSVRRDKVALYHGPSSVLLWCINPAPGPVLAPLPTWTNSNSPEVGSRRIFRHGQYNTAQIRFGRRHRMEAGFVQARQSCNSCQVLDTCMRAWVEIDIAPQCPQLWLRYGNSYLWPMTPSWDRHILPSKPTMAQHTVSNWIVTAGACSGAKHAMYAARNS